MSQIVNIGMNHETAPVELRECLAAGLENTGRVLASMRSLDCIKEGLFLSTCNRVESLFITDNPEEAKDSVLSMMASLGDFPEERLIPAVYIMEGMDAVVHVFRVASSLDSMILGEPQILGQMKEAYAWATREKTSGVIVNRLMHKAFHVAKRVRTETGICEAAVSISYAAVELAKKIFHELKGKKVLLIGAGEMAELAARHLIVQGVSSICVANRTLERAVTIAEKFRATPVSFDEIGHQLVEADIVVTSTASPEWVITLEEAKKAVKNRKNRPLFLIDIAVPRDVQPEVNRLHNVYVYDIDELKGAVEFNKIQRRQEAFKADRIVREEVIKFEKWLKTLAVVPTIASLKSKAESIIEAEMKRSGTSLRKLEPEQLKAVEILTRSVAEKVLHDPIVFLKQRADRPTVNNYIDVTRKLFSLDEEENK